MVLALSILKDEHIYTVSSLSQSLKKTVETSFQHIKVKGEVSSYKCHTSGHHYFTLKDQESVLDGVAWRGTPFKVQICDGMEVIATGKLTTYPGRSKYQMIVTHIEPSGEGALLKILQDRIQKLKEEGLFDRKRPLPKFPKRIGIITSPTGAVIQDMLHRIEARYPCHVMLWPVLVQGVGAKEQICQAIEGFNQMEIDQKPDVLIIARGGGSLEDLWTFNEEDVARATFASLIPTISAVGHETDTTLIDFVSDQRAPTPTAAAEIITPDRQVLRSTVNVLGKRLDQSYSNIVKTKRDYFLHLSKRLPDVSRWLQQKNDDLSLKEHRLQLAMNQMMKYLKQSVDKTIIPSPIKMYQHKKDILSRYDVTSLYQRHIKNLTQHLSLQCAFLDQHNVFHILKKGFCIIKYKNNVIDPMSLEGAQHVDLDVQSYTGHCKIKGNVECIPGPMHENL